MTATAKKAKEVKEIKKEPVIYLGKSIKNTVKHGQVFTNGIPFDLQVYLEMHPEVNNLLVNVSKSPEVLRSINTKKGMYFDIYKNM